MKRYLSVDTSSVIRKVMKRVIENEGGIVMEAEAAEHMIELASYEMPDCIILSSAIDDMDTETAIRAIREMPDGKHPKILLSLVDVNIAKIMRAKRAGADGYLLKPFDRDTLMAALSEVVGTDADDVKGDEASAA